MLMNVEKTSVKMEQHVLTAMAGTLVSAACLDLLERIVKKVYETFTKVNQIYHTCLMHVHIVMHSLMNFQISMSVS